MLPTISHLFRPLIKEKYSKVVPRKSMKAEGAIILLYGMFFLLWLIGYLTGIFEEKITFFSGLPLWFVISCFFSFLFVIAGLFIVSKRYF